MTIGFLFAFIWYLFKFNFSLINSVAFSSFSTLLVGGIAIYLYLIQKKDTKIQAARVLLLEIRTAEERISQIKEEVQDGLLHDLPSVFPTKSWKIYSNLFVSDFDQDELRSISLFYDYCELIEDFAKRNNDFFWVTTEERARIIQQKLADLVIHSQTTEESIDLDLAKQKILDAFANDSYLYSPQKTINEIKKYSEKINAITTTSVGIKLKKIANMY